MRRQRPVIKVIDIFAGPGGLSEGFAAVTDAKGKPVFDVMLSIEKDEQAHATLLLRTFFRQFHDSVPDAYYRLLRGEIDRETLFKAHPVEAKLATARSWHATLGAEGEDHAVVRKRIREAVGTDTGWVLIGGPPCQAYSIAGRSRNKGKLDYDPAKDERQRLYVEYLQILAEHRPAVFIMENVKGLLSATLENERVFHRILEDLRDPAKAIAREGRGGTHVRKGGYRIHSLTEDHVFENGTLRGSVIEAEKYGIPQARHRVILLGIRDDINGVKPRVLTEQKAVSTTSVIGSLPKLRGGLSPRSKDSAAAWKSCLQSQATSRWANAGTCKVDGLGLALFIREKLADIALPRADRGAEFLEGEATTKYAPKWFADDRIGGVCNHTSRAHMKKDLYRYFYAACYAKYHRVTPTLRQFPTDLLPDHDSVDDAIANGGHFSDRFRVQVGSRPSTTIVSHISKDGHYYIHHDPLQCRSLTVREAARLQTFPDNYFFCGNRTAQYIQVGNAVPPLLARRIGRIVRDFLKAAGVND
ncbi:MAG: DNA cytosine methyltransferase [Phycisphaerales bacterium]|nr:DNA cytosine methyltransferase [Phycisphaerales bacterium]